MGRIRDNLQENLISYLEKENITQKQLAELLGVTQAAVTNWVKGKNSPDIELVAEMCNIFNVKITDLMGYDDNPQDQRRQQLLHNYDKLNDTAQNALVMYSDFMVSKPENLKSDTEDNKMNA